MLAASLSLFTMVSALVAFGAWPGDATSTNVDDMLVTSIEKPKKHSVAVRRDAGLRASRASGRGSAPAPRSTGGAGGPSHATTGSGTALALPTGSAPSSSGAGSQTPTDSPVKTVTRTTQPLLQNAPQPVQDVATQVDQVINQVGEAVPPAQPVTDAASGVLGP